MSGACPGFQDTNSKVHTGHFTRAFRLRYNFQNRSLVIEDGHRRQTSIHTAIHYAASRNFMKIEKINDNQIRCTLTMADLASRKINLGELAYGSEKARNLFRDMMTEAYHKFGFNVDNVPIMIEAVPMSSEGIVLIITKVEDPEELDTRFSRFTMPREAQAGGKEPAGADDILDAVHRAIEKRKKSGKPKDAEKKQEGSGQEEVQGSREKDADIPEEPNVDILLSYVFSRMDDVLQAAASIGSFYTGDNSLYHMKNGSYVLTLHRSEHTPEEFNKVCNIMSEYGTGRKVTAASEAYVREHEQVVISGNALQELSRVMSDGKDD